jgi:osmotically-inducible protein OsmY
MKARQFFILMAVTLVLLVPIAPIYAATSDSDIEDAVKDSYTYKTYLNNDDVEVQVKDGVVTLTGTVAEESHKSLAEETVANQIDVKRVDNKLDVKNESSPDLWLMTKVKSTLLFHRNVSATTNVDVTDGVVTLSGEADNQAQKALTGEYAMDIEGVTSVTNEMTVGKTTKESQPSRDKAAADRPVGDKAEDRSMGEKIDDASITALVKTTLLSHRSTSGLKTRVETTDGVVSLSGKAGSDSEKSLAAKLTRDVRGVRSVDNKMTVDNNMTAQ